MTAELCYILVHGTLKFFSPEFDFSPPNDPKYMSFKRIKKEALENDLKIVSTLPPSSAD